MSSDWTNVAVAVITASATLSGAAVTQFFTLRGKHIDAGLQRDQRAEERRYSFQKEALDEKRSSYASLNSAVHYFRTAAQHYLKQKSISGSLAVSSAQFDAAWDALRASYSQAQMVLSDHALAVAHEVIRSMELAHSAVRDVAPGATPQIEVLQSYLDGTLGYAVRLMRRALRADLGIEMPADVDIDERRELLKARRDKVFDTDGRLKPPPPALTSSS